MDCHQVPINYNFNKLKNSENMKKTKFQGKLSLKKETVARLNDAQMNDVKGGSIFVQTLKCPVVVFPTKPIPSCTITTNTFDKISVIDKNVIIHH